ncbi:interleukin-10 receptor subunit beta-like [Xyrichtys novacula]|uniref:Interleukin-10 receptor subunit beta-like n=1 Tax=Xyrichtys novacula TaxID=13765 RepID=A0AAV1H2G6_XYRNO|nr:interleukin-10 receptor subunit beta-like [Xyrichtys novacula]
MNLTDNMIEFILIVFTLSGSSGLLPPSSVRLTSYNMDLVLRWDPPPEAEGDLLYTAQYKSAHKDWVSVCLNSSLHQCDLSHLKTSIFVFGTYTGRVRTERGEERSEWRESNILTLDKHTIIGPPSVSVLAQGKNIEVSITDPKFAISSLRDVYGTPTYYITYWREGQPEKAINITQIQHNPVVLDKLLPRTKYCVQVEIHTELNPKPSEASRIVCESTGNREAATWVIAVVIFVIMAVVMALVLLTVIYRKRISHFLCPKVTLPLHFEPLKVPLNPLLYQATDNTYTPEEVCHPVSIIPHQGCTDKLLLQEQRTVDEQQ